MPIYKSRNLIGLFERLELNTAIFIYKSRNLIGLFEAGLAEGKTTRIYKSRNLIGLFEDSNCLNLSIYLQK